MSYQVEDVVLDDHSKPFGLGLGRATGGHFKYAICGQDYNLPPEGEDEVTAE